MQNTFMAPTIFWALNKSTLNMISQEFVNMGVLEIIHWSEHFFEEVQQCFKPIFDFFNTLNNTRFLVLSLKLRCQSFIFSNAHIEFTPAECMDEELLDVDLPSKNRRHRTTYTDTQLRELEAAFKERDYPDHGVKKMLAEKLGLQEERVSVSALHSVF